MSLLVARGVRVAFGATVAVDDVDLTCYRGEVTALIGPNGAGKSSFIDAVAGVVPATGQISLDGVALNGRPPHKRVAAGIGRTFQTPALLGPTPLAEVALAACVGRGVAGGFFAAPGDREFGVARDLLGRVHLPEARWELPAADLGLPDQRRTEVARALATSPRLLMLDEPASGLPAGDRPQIAELLLSLAGPDLGVLVVEHDMALVATIAHVVIALDRGRVVATGSYADVAADPVVRQSYLGEDTTAEATVKTTT